MTMDLFNRISPAYKSAASFTSAETHARRAATSGGLSGLLGSLLGNASPAYKSIDGHGVNTSASSSGLFGSLFGSLFGTATPSYKTASAPAATVETLDDASIEMDAGNGDGSSMPCVPTSDEVVLL